MTSPRWLSRYRAGRRDQVWQELGELGRAVRDEPDRAAEAQLVCDEMAGRARQNVDVLIERLTADGYRFHTNDSKQTPETPHVAPTPGAAGQAAWLEERLGEVPMTLLSWTRLVGDVWLVGTHPHWPESASGDPLVIEVEGSRYPGAAMRDYIEDELEQWREDLEEDSAAGPFVLPLAPDRLHKENVSGGGPYGVILPDGAADAVFTGETTTPFVTYLNLVFRSGGFPWPTGGENEERIKRDLARDLLPL